jgi:hypothetical protein
LQGSTNTMKVHAVSGFPHHRTIYVGTSCECFAKLFDLRLINDPQVVNLGLSVMYRDSYLTNHIPHDVRPCGNNIDDLLAWCK